MIRFVMMGLLLFTMACGGGGGGDETPTTPPGPAPAPEITKIPPRPDNQEPMPWWNNNVFYEVFVRSYADSQNGDLAGDGIGDLRGLIERLDYLNDGNPDTTDDLGVTALWLMPVMQSPSYHGYDVSDYGVIESDYGTNEDFQTLMDEAKRRGMRIVVDLVLNHTSSSHPWFRAAGNRDGAFDDYYVWSDTNPGFRGPWDQQVWHPSGDRFYYGLFWGGMPDLNYNNPAVTTEVEAITRFWLQDMRVDGFRLDAIRYLVEDGQNLDDTEQNHEWLRNYHAFYKELNPEAVTIGEVWAAQEIVTAYEADQMDMNFQFDLATAILQAANASNGSSLMAQLTRAWDSFQPGQFATFITNHDQDRVMSQLNGDVDRARLAATLLLTMPGVPFIYYGEEIGMTGQKPDELIRTPLHWDASQHAGFSSNEPWQPVNDDYAGKNIALQSADPDSLLSHYRNMIHLRNGNSALSEGNMTVVNTSSSNVVAWLRQSTDQDVLVVINLSGGRLDSFSIDLEADYTNSVELIRGTPLTTGAVKTVNGVAGYQPMDALSARTGYIIRLSE